MTDNSPFIKLLKALEQITEPGELKAWGEANRAAIEALPTGDITLLRMGYVRQMKRIAGE